MATNSNRKMFSSVYTTEQARSKEGITILKGGASILVSQNLSDVGNGLLFSTNLGVCDADMVEVAQELPADQQQRIADGVDEFAEDCRVQIRLPFTHPVSLEARRIAAAGTGSIRVNILGLKRAFDTRKVDQTTGVEKAGYLYNADFVEIFAPRVEDYTETAPAATVQRSAPVQVTKSLSIDKDAIKAKMLAARAATAPNSNGQQQQPTSPVEAVSALAVNKVIKALGISGLDHRAIAAKVSAADWAELAGATTEAEFREMLADVGITA